MESQYRIFYSWQSDNSEAKDIVGRALNNVVKKLKTERISLKIEQGGGGCGFISIEESVRIKIRRSDIFVGDVTPVGNVKRRKKLLPNANVMYEMGLATECMAPERVLAVAMDGDWKIENMPFDFNHNTMLKFDKEKGEQSLYNAIIKRIRSTINFSKKENSRFFSKRVVDKNIKSGKYLPDTFLENREVKDIVRCFVAPSLTYAHVYDQLNRLNFDYYNKRKKLEGIQINVKLNLDKWDISQKTYDIELLQNIIKEVYGYVKSIYEKIEGRDNLGYFTSKKVKTLANNLDAMCKKLMVVTSDAGQGKTNFVCDLINNVLEKNGIPYVFVNAYELSAESLARSIAAEYNFISNNSLDEVLQKSAKYCNQNLQSLIIVVDGLNEHPQQGLFKTNLARVLGAICEYKHVKVLMTCRKQYFEKNYQNFQKGLSQNLIEVPLRVVQNVANNEYANESCLLERYGLFFKTGVPKSANVRRILLENMLLLRIFFEANQGENIENIDSLDYANLYQRYYSQQCEKIQQVIEQDSRVNNPKGIAKKIFAHIVKWMIDQDCFRNLPLNDVQKTMTEDERLCFTSFVNTNIILQIDSPEEIDGISEVLNFTFEEIRDFLVAQYIIDCLFQNDEEKFNQLIDRYSNENNAQSEGTKRFLFLYAKNIDNQNVLQILMQKMWYEGTFLEYVWDVPDEKISSEDVERLKNYLENNPDDNVKKLAYWHWSPEKYSKINLNLLLEILGKKNIDERKDYLEKIWPSLSKHQTLHRKWESSERKKILKALREGIAKRSEMSKKQEYDVLEKMMVYLSEGMSDNDEQAVRTEKSTIKKQEFKYSIFEYDFHCYLMKVHKGSKGDFLAKAGVKSGYAKEMFGNIYDSIFAEAEDVKSLYEKYYSNEYSDLEHFLEMRYSIPKDCIQEYSDACESDMYRLIDFNSLSYGGNGINDFFANEEWKMRIYKWLNWGNDEN